MNYPKIEITNTRHVYIVPGISREEFQNVGVRETDKDPSLAYYIHGHAYDPFGGIECNDKCQVIRTGKVHYVTQLDDANDQSDT